MHIVRTRPDKALMAPFLAVWMVCTEAFINFRKTVYTGTFTKFRQDKPTEREFVIPSTYHFEINVVQVCADWFSGT